MVSSDPNKREATVRLPLRRVKTSIPLRKPGRYSHLRLEFNMKGGAWWRLYELNEGWMPSAHFASAFAVAPTAADPTPWIYVDLGTDVVIDHVRLHWGHKARRGEIQFSEDARQWRTVGTLPVVQPPTRWWTVGVRPGMCGLPWPSPTPAPLRAQRAGGVGPGWTGAAGDRRRRDQPVATASRRRQPVISATVPALCSPAT
jgi:hypothetical protein